MSLSYHFLPLLLMVGLLAATDSDITTVDWSRVTGADIDESVIGQVLHVDAAAEPDGDGSEANPFASIDAALAAAGPLLADAIACKILIAPGTYREGEWTIGGAAADTLLVIEGAAPGAVTITGTDLFPLAEWRRVERDDGTVYYEHDWPHDFGFNPGGWQEHNPKLPYEHRSELMFIDGVPQRQVLLEQYEYIPVDPDRDPADIPPTDSFVGVPQDTAKHGSYRYLGVADPLAMPPGSFGVFERPENGDRLVWKPAVGVDPTEVTIEVAVRRHHLWIHRRGNVVLRNLTFHGVAGQIEAHTAVMVGHWYQPELHIDNRQVLIEDCQFLYNNNTALALRRCQDVTLRRVTASHGGYGGLSMNGTHNVLWEDTTVAFNCWRVAGGWSAGGVKIHRTLDMISRRHTAIGNDGVGLWFDISCDTVLVEDLVSVGNELGLDWEISRGLLLRDSVLADNDRASIAIVSGEDVHIERTLMDGSPAIAHFIFQASDRDSSTWIYDLAGREAPESYALDTLSLRDSVCTATAQPADSPGGSDHDGTWEPGWEPYLFFQHHGNPTWFETYVDEGVTDSDNLWFSPREEAFGIRKLYPEDWREQAPRCVTEVFDDWYLRVSGSGSIWGAPQYRDRDAYDLRPADDESPVAGIPVPRWRLDPDLLARWRDFQDADWHVRFDPTLAAQRSILLDCDRPDSQASREGGPAQSLPHTWTALPAAETQVLRLVDPLQIDG